MKPTLLLLLIATLTYAQSRPINPAVKEAVGYLLTTDKLEKYSQASRNVTALIAKDPGYAAKMKPTEKETPNTVDETVAWSKAHVPVFVGAVEKTGISFREYILFQESLIITVEAYKRPQYAASFHIRRENIRFVQTNWAKIQDILAQQRTHTK